MYREIYASYGVPFPQIRGKAVKFFQKDGSSVVTAEVFAFGSPLPEWSAEAPRLEAAVTAVRKQYGLTEPGDAA